MPRHSNSKTWPHNSKLTISKRPKDILIYTKTDGSGHVQTNKKTWGGFKATVILGTHPESNNRIVAPAKTLIWTCDITSRGRLSTLTHEGKTYSNEDVTVLIHVK